MKRQSRAPERLAGVGIDRQLMPAARTPSGITFRILSLPHPTSPVTRLPFVSWLYVAVAGIAIVLGGATVVAHLNQPSFPAIPGRGCVVTTIPSPDSRYLPAPYLAINACVHISETVVDLVYHDELGGRTDPLFEVHVEVDPRRWADAIAVRWITVDTVLVTYREDVRFARRDPTFIEGHVVYRRRPLEPTR